MCDTRGIVRVGPTDALVQRRYGDYIRHFMAGLGAVPAWAPPGEDISFDPPQSCPRFTTIAAASATGRSRMGEEVVRLTFVPATVIADGAALSRTDAGAGWTYDAAMHVLRVRRSGARSVTIQIAATH
jgi:hypothetical protein